MVWRFYIYAHIFKIQHYISSDILTHIKRSYIKIAGFFFYFEADFSAVISIQQEKFTFSFY